MGCCYQQQPILYFIERIASSKSLTILVAYIRNSRATAKNAILFMA